MVDAVVFRGTHALRTDSLAVVIATERTGLWRRWFGWNTGVLTCLDSLEVLRDAIRLREEYAERGYAGTLVTAAITRHGNARARVTFAVTEAAPIRIDSAVITGVPSDAANVPSLVRRLRGVPLDTVLLGAIRDSVQNLIRTAGYARAQASPAPLVVVDSARRRATVTMTFTPGRVINIGEIAIKISPAGPKPALDSGDVLALLRFKSGDRFNPRLVSATQRELYDLGLYRTIRIDTATYDTTANAYPLRVQLTEGALHRLRLGSGWGTLDCFRAQARYVDQNLTGGDRLEINTRLSKIGVAAPFSGLSSLCAPEMRSDPYSQNLNYYGGATFTLRGAVGAQYRPTFTLYSERRSEVGIYEQTTAIGGIVSLTRALVDRLTQSLQYQYVDARTVADAAVSCERFGFCQALDATSFRTPSPIHTLSATIVKNPLLPTDDPVGGFRWQFEVREGVTSIARTGSIFFTRLVAEGAFYQALSSQFVLALRAQVGNVFAPKGQAVLLPPSERFYGGGQSSVRGFNQNTLGPGSYIVSGFTQTTLPDSTIVGIAQPGDFRRPAPSGGNAMWVANIELRTRRGWPSNVLGLVAFVDAGRVWNTSDAFNSFNAGARVTPGLGVRLATPLGPFRMDIGYNGYNPDPAPAFFVQTADAATGRLARVICVSQGTTDPLTLAAGARGAAQCPATFTPAIRGGLLPRLAFQFSIGQAF